MIDVAQVVHAYGSRRALDEVSFQVAGGECFVLCGPNGGGKSTLFRLLSTLLPLTQGRISIGGCALPEQTAPARRLLGVVFQSPSTDKKLTVLENLRYQGHLYGLSGASLQERCRELLAEFEVADRAGDRVETLSGGLRRRVEVAKALLHRPRILLLDEPTTGLDPGARSTLWKHLQRLREQQGVTVLATTHLLEEADRADRLAILDRGRLVALDTPEALRSSLGGDTVTLTTLQPQQLVDALAARFGLDAQIADGQVRLALADGHQWIARLVEAFSGEIQAVTLGKPTLEDVFVARTGHGYHGSEDMSA